MATDPAPPLPHDAAPLLNVGAIVPCTEAEGPGRRFALWVQGCPLRCPGCCNPHLLEFREADRLPIDALHARIRSTQGIEGVTFLGGEPFSQAAALALLAECVRTDGLSVMIFTGHTLAELRAAGRGDWNALLDSTDLLVDGPYLRERHSTARRWIGSDNQQVHFLTERYGHLRPENDGWPREGQTLELRLTAGGEITINGFPHRDFTRLAVRTP